MGEVEAGVEALMTQLERENNLNRDNDEPVSSVSNVQRNDVAKTPPAPVIAAG